MSKQKIFTYLFLSILSVSSVLAADLIFKLPYQKGERFIITRGYNTLPTHAPNSKDQYALDFTKNGCEAYGKNVLTVVDGKVILVLQDGYNGGYGTTVLINHGNNLISRYAHLIPYSIGVAQNQDVRQGTIIGKIGRSGEVSGSACPEYPGTHLHFAMYQRQPDGKLIAYKPEPMSGYTNFVAGNWYLSDNEIFQTRLAEEQLSQQPSSQPESSSNFWQNLGSLLTGWWQGITSLINNLLGLNQESQSGEQEKAVNQELGITNQELIYDAKLIERNPNQNLTLKENQEIFLSVKFKNTGNTIWQKETVSLNVASEEAKNFYHSSWLTKKRPAKLKESEIKPNEIGSFEFFITAKNLEPKIYQFSFRPVYQDSQGFHWLGGETVSWQIAFEKSEEKIVLEPAPGSLSELNLLSPLLEKTNQENLLETEKIEEEKVTPIVYFGGGGGSPSPPPDITPPEITLTAFPNNPTNTRHAIFEFSANENVTFKCKLDDKEKEDCLSPKIYYDLSEGEHSFFLEAFDLAGNQASFVYLWQIDLTPPTSAILTSGTFVGLENLPSSIEGIFEGEDTEKIFLAIQREKDSQYLAQLSSFSWQKEEFWFEATLDWENKKWQFAWPKDLIEEGNYKIYVRAKDKLGNQQEPAIQSCITYLLRPFLENWKKRKAVIIDNTNSSETLTNFEINLLINYQPEMKLDFSDLRFTDEDGQTLLNYGWEINDEGLAKKENGLFAEAVVRIPEIPANSRKKIYLYYGNQQAGSVANLEKTLTWFDHFDQMRMDDYDFNDVDWLTSESKIQIGVNSVGWLKPKIEIKNFWLKSKMSRGGPNGSTFLYWRYLDDQENSWQIHSGSTNWLYGWTPWGVPLATWGYMKGRAWYELGRGILWEGGATLWEVKAYETKHSVEVKDVLPFSQTDRPVFNQAGKIFILDWWSCWCATCPWPRPWDWRTFVDYLYLRQYVEPMPLVYFE
ncbi:MAG: DUF2341 domain-containing protein [Patescibacteria group bacterium]|nr:DUF2341 domain-containing protein [Patescibacteria group bacterium]